ncbi:MAG: CRTAC1 family protein [Saprospirales bacterium]|nr:CRTAC1 family protein [Saprospirales bacterium]
MIPFFPHRLLYAGLMLLLSPACKNSSESADQPAAQNGTQEMIRLVNEANKKIDPSKVPYFFNAARAEYYSQLADQATDPLQRISHRMNFGYELLSAGENEQSIIVLESLLEEVQKIPEATEDDLQSIKRLIALNYFRLGEQNNCIAQPNAESCIFPISEKGVYAIKTATERAIQLFEEMLQSKPDNYESIWMLNIAYMSLGRYPQDVPAKWLLPESSFRSQTAFPAFVNAAAKAGLKGPALSGGTAVDDFNNDGLLDIFASSWGVADQIRFYINKGDGTFEESSQKAGLTGVTGGLNVAHADYDNDGWMDLLVLRGAWFAQQGEIPNSLLRNNGDGTFTDVTIAAGLLSYHPTQAAVWTDFNLDGWLDLFIGNESTMGTTDQPCEFYLSNGKDPKTGQVTFTNQIDACGLSNLRGMIKGVASSDINNDGRPDLYISQFDRPNQLLINIGIAENGLVSFQDVTQHTGTGEPLNSFPCWFWDYDNDGWEDIFAASYSIQGGVSASEMMMKYYLDKPVENLPRLYRNLGNGKFENVAPKVGLNEPIYGMGSNYGDLNNDGFLDCYIGTGAPSFSALVPNKMYLNNKGVSFLDVTTSSRTGHLQKGHGVGFGDFDNDGDEDIFAVIGGAFEGDVSENALFMNPSGNNNPWLRIVLEGRKVNRSAIGARVLVQLVDSKGETRYLFRTVSGGSSFGGNSMELEFGLGDAQRVEEVHVIWPDKARTFSKHANIPMNKKIKIVEGQTEVEVLEERKISFQGL